VCCLQHQRCTTTLDSHADSTQEKPQPLLKNSRCWITRNLPISILQKLRQRPTKYVNHGTRLADTASSCRFRKHKAVTPSHSKTLCVELLPTGIHVNTEYTMADSRNNKDTHCFLPFPLALQIHLSLLQNLYAIAADTIERS
jgi:hypothetical protein